MFGPVLPLVYPVWSSERNSGVCDPERLCVYSLHLCVGCVLTFTQNCSSLASVPGGGEGSGSLGTCCSFPVFLTAKLGAFPKD